MSKKLSMIGGAAALSLGLVLTGCGAEEQERPASPPEVAETTPAPVEPQPHLDPPAPLPELDEEEPWGGLFTEEELAANYLETLRMEPSSPGIRALDDATLLEYGLTVCPAVEAGATFDQFTFPGMDPYLEAPMIAGAAVGTWCPELIEAATGGAY